WRALDREQGQCCELAAGVLRALGMRELAWEYMTTPVGLAPGESSPWQNMAQALNREGDFALANLAYKAAFEAEPTNAQILWEQAQNLRRGGEKAEARKLLRQLAAGDWQPRFNGLKSEAHWQLEGK